MTRVLGLETSCDETAVAVVTDGVTVVAERVSSQIDIHAPFGGVIPEVASRSHLEVLFPLIHEVVDESGLGWNDLDALAVTHTPGLIGCLLVGLSAAKGLSLATGLPLVGVNHVHAHIYGALMDGLAAGRTPEWPLASLVVSGGHTSLYASHSPIEHVRVARTIDDAAGEAYDKVAKLLGLPYPGGPVIDRLAVLGDRRAYRFPVAKISDKTMDFSFSGIKTAVLRRVKEEGLEPLDEEGSRRDQSRLDLLAGFQEGVVHALVSRTMQAARLLKPRSILISGGVAANSRLREAMREAAAERNLAFDCPSPILTTDNAVMIAAAGTFKLQRGERSGYDLDADPNLRLAPTPKPSKKGRWKT